MNIREFRLGGAALAFLMTFQAGALAAAPAGGHAADSTSQWAPAQSSIIEPSNATDVDGWRAYKGKFTNPSTDQHLDDPILKGAVDIHAHFGPDVFDRQWDAFEIARIALARGMRGLVFKNHWSESAGLAYLARKYAAPGLEIFGGLALNTVEGGINPMAVRYFAETEGHYGKIVWMPTHDSEHEVKYLGEKRPYVIVSRDGALLPEVHKVLDLIAHYHLTLATGHVYPREMLQIVAAAKERGIDRIIITHPGLGPMFTDPTIDELKQAVALGGKVEVVSTALFAKNNKAIIDMIRTLGSDNCIISTDSGLIGTPNHADALVLSARILRQAGFSEADLNLMFKTNPARILGLSQR